MPSKIAEQHLRSGFIRFRCFFAGALALGVASVLLPAQSRAGTEYYARANTLGIVAAYSWDSSHMLLGDAERRKLINIGISYNRRLLINHVVNWQYSGELLPVALESDPLQAFVNHQTSPTNATYAGFLPYPMVTCAPVASSYSYTFNGENYSGTQTDFCYGRQWTVGEALSPVGMQWNFFPLGRVQPFLVGHGGYMYSTQPIPVDGAGSFNFTFDIGAGIELYRSKAQSVRVEYRYHHISNHDTASFNPGIDNGLLQITYSFRLGRR